MLFFKVQYKKSIKKIQLRPEELKWDDLLKLLGTSFHLLDTEQIKLTYKDAEGDSVIVKSEDDLLEAIRLNQNDQMLKLHLEDTGRDQPSSDNDNLKNLKISKSEQEASSVSSGQTKPEELSSLMINFEEIQPIFDEVLGRPELMTLLMQVIAKRSIASKGPRDVKIDCAEAQFLEYFNKKLTDLARNLQREKEEAAESYKSFLASTQKVLANLESKAPEEPNGRDEAPKPLIQESFKSIQSLILTESVYEPVTQSTIEQSTKSPNPKIENVTDSANLEDSSGFRYILKFDNGRPHFVAVPVSSLNSQKSK